MFYIQTLKNLYEHVKNNSEISADEKEKAKELIAELTRLLAMY